MNEDTDLRLLTHAFAGTTLPPTLTVLHEHSDHFSMQCTRPMELEGT